MGGYLKLKKMRKDIFKKGNKKIRALCLLLLSFFVSCTSENRLDFHIKVDRFANDNFEEVSEVYGQMNSWIENSIKARLYNVKSLIFNSNYTVDRLVLMNDSKSKLVGTINVRNSIRNNVTHDFVHMFWGVKINGEWYFTKGGNLFVPRENYKYDIYEPLSDYELSYIGRDYFLKHFLHIDGESLSINSDLIDKHVSIRNGSKYKEDSDKNWLNFFEEMQSKKVSQNKVDDINQSIRNEVEEDHTLPEKGSKAWKELYGSKTPLFERDEWKDHKEKMKKTN